MNTPSQAMVTSSARCPVPQAGRSLMVAIVLSLAVHAVAIAAAGIWVATNKPEQTTEPACPVTQFMKVHLIRQAAPAPVQVASVAPAAAKPVPRRTVTTPKAKAAPTLQSVEPAPPLSSQNPVIPASPAHPSFVATELTESQPGGSPSTAIPARLAAGSNSAITYPPTARRMGWEGVVTLNFWLNEQGNPSRFRITTSSGYPELDSKALQTVRNWSFQPHIMGGQPTPVWATLPVTFKLTDK